MSTKIFISYRRDDSQAQSELVYQALIERFGPSAIFMDSNAIEPGSKWPDRIKQSLSDAHLVLAVIISPGKWMGVDIDTGERRIDDNDDWVHQELATSFEARKHLLPILLKTGEIPKKKILPDSIHALPEMQSLKLDFANWSNDKKLLVAECEQLLKNAGAPAPRVWTPAELDKEFGSFASLAAQVFYVQSIDSFMDAIETKKADLDRFVATVRSVRNTKELHDIAHDVQVTALALIKQRMMDPISGTLDDAFRPQYETIKQARKHLTKEANIGPSVEKEKIWIDKFLNVLTDMEGAIREDDKDLFPLIVEEMERVLKTQQATLNTRLVCLINGDLYLKDVVRALTDALHEKRSKGLDPDREQAINLACKKLNLFEQEFQMLLDIHDKWQKIDIDLSGLEGELSHHGESFDIDHVSNMLSGVRQKLQLVLDASALDDLQFVDTMNDNLRKLSGKIGKIKRGMDIENIELEATFRLFMYHAQSIFRLIDKLLRKRCIDLVNLEALVRELLVLYNNYNGESHA